VIERIRKENDDTLDSVKIEGAFAAELSKTRFLGVGNPSESGTHLLYYFRQENSLGKEYFINTHETTSRNSESGELEIRDKTIKEYVFIDDLCGSGTQACDYSKDVVAEIKALNPSAKVSYYVLFAMKDGINKVKNESKFDVVDCVYELDDSFKCFSSSSRHYSAENLKVRGKNIASKYGRNLFCDALGYSDCQLLLGFLHNTPDNTLPIIWSSDNWKPIFKRYNKDYGWGM